MESIPIKNSLKLKIKLKMFCKTISRKQSIGQLLTQVPRRKSSTGNGADFLLQPQAKPAQIAGQHELSSLAPSNGLLKKEAMKPRLISHMHQLSSMAHPALANTQYPPISPQNLEVHPAKKDDEKEKQEILELFLEQFMLDEPLSRCLKLNREETEPFFRAIVDACTRDEPSVSLLVRDSTANNKLVGVLLNHLLARTENAPNLYENKNYSPNVALFCKIVHCCESHLWDLLPKNVNLVCNNVFMSVRRDYAKMGIGQQMVELSELNVQQMDGVQAGVGELTAIGTQKIYARCGYKPLLSIPYNMWMNERGKQIVEAANGFPIPESIQLVGKFYCFD